jgi:hypothetical protein
MTKAIEIPYSTLYFVIGEQEGLFAFVCEMEKVCNYSQQIGNEFPPKVTEVALLEDKKTIAFKIEEKAMVDYVVGKKNLDPKVYFQGIVADDTKVY